MAGTLFGVRLLSSTLGPAAYGDLALWLTLAAVGQGVIQSPLSQAQLRLYSAASERGELDGYWAASDRLGLRSAMIVSAICITIGLVIGGVPSLGTAAAACAFAVSAGEMARYTSVAIAAQRRKLAAFAQSGHEWLRPLLAAGALLIWPKTTAAALLGFGASAIILAVIQRARLRGGQRVAGAGSTRPTTVMAWQRQMLDYGWPFVLWGIAASLQSNADRWVMGLLGARAEVGNVAILAQLGVGPLVVLSGAVSQYAAPIVFARIGAELSAERVAAARGLVIRLVLGGLVATAVMVAGVALVGGPVFRLLVDARFIGAARLWPVALLAGGLFGVSQLASLLPLALSRPTLLLPVKIVHSVVAISATVAGGLMAAVAGIMWGAVIANAFALAWTMWIALRAARSSMAPVAVS